MAQLRTLPTFFLQPYRLFRNYRIGDLRPDLLAGLTVALVVLPQAMAYALIAELPPQTGLYAAIAGAIVGALWGSSNQLQTGPTNAESLLVLSVLLPLVAPGTPEYLAAAGLLALLIGIFRTTMGLARLGMLVNFVSDSVVVGYTAGAGALIVANQMRNLLRLPIASDPELVNTVAATVRHSAETHWPSLLLGVATMAIVWGLQWVSRQRRPGRRGDRNGNESLRSVAPTPLPGPLIALVAASIIAAVVQPSLGESGFKVVGQIPRELPPVARLPLTDLRLIGSLSTGALAISAIGLVEAMSIARSIAAQTRQRLDSNQEFVGQGLANIASAAFSGYTCAGSFTRSAVNMKAGARTPLASAFSGLFVLVAMLALAPLAAFIPQCALAGVLVVTAVGLIDRKEMVRIWRSGESDRAIMVLTLSATLFLPLQFAVLTGILMSLAFYILKTSTPRVRTVLPDEHFEHFVHQPEKPSCPQLGIIEILGDLYFGAAHHVEECISQNLAENRGQRFLLLRMQSVEHCDISGIHALEAVAQTYRGVGGDLFLTRVRRPVLEVMAGTGFQTSLGDDHFLSQDGALERLFHKVLDPAVCIYECPVRAFRECRNLPKQLHGQSASEPGSESVSLPIPDGRALEEVRYITPQALWQALHSVHPPLVVDVREPREFRRGHIVGALSVPLPGLLKALQGEAPLPNPIREALPRPPHGDVPQVVFVCRGGRRSSRVAALVQSQGGGARHLASAWHLSGHGAAPNVMALEGGMLAWEAARLLEAVEELA